ncbi:hypothetical protein V5799_004296 [Amblyomma americanum]|uniref:Uncharacterized protein n=1 Tax=Amblyomma americanum TaxID=6943 RepID=A0AAQ4D6I2_AMBAM
MTTASPEETRGDSVQLLRLQRSTRLWVLAFGAASPAGKNLRNVLVVARAQCESDNRDFRRQVQVALQERAAAIADHGLVPLESWRWRRPKRRRRKNKKRKAAVVVAGAAGVPLRQRQQLNSTKGGIAEEEEDEGCMAKEEQDEYDRSSQTEVFTLSAKTLCRRYVSYAKYLSSEWNRMGRQRPTKQHGGS